MDLRLAVVLAVVAAANAGPINVRQHSRCSTQCTESSKFKYNVGGTYRYDYEGSVQTTIFGASEGASGMQLKATADFEVIDSCDLSLRLRNVRLEETDKTGRSWAVLGAESFKRSLEEHPLRFSYQDGRIEEVCPMYTEEPWVANIKRGVLSSFQNSMDDFQTEAKLPETDVAGNCRADYRIMSRQYTTVTVNKTKDLLACTERHGFKTAMQATPYRVPSDIQSLPLSKSSHECIQTLSTTNGHLMKANCEEHHIFRPFSQGHNGAMTHAKHSLQFIGLRPGVRSRLGDNFRRSNMLYEHDKEEVKTSRDTRGVTNALNAICEQTVNDVRPETPRLFSELVYKMKELEPIAMKQLHRQIISKRICRRNHDAAKKYFHDALPMAGTPASVSLISELVNQRHVRGSEADMWVSSLAFIQNPTSEMLNSVKELLLAPNPSRSAYLAGSALVNSYCKKEPSCTSESTISQIHSLLERNLNRNCRVTSRSSSEQIIMSLKALGNMANAPSTDDTLSRCFAEDTNPTDIRLAALEALRKQTCTADRRSALRLYTDGKEDSELRIAGYLTAMSCATEETIKTVENTLNSESVNQVGSFVWTHLTNLMETSDPHKQRIRRILDSTTLKKTFDLDKRKYSRNFEGAMFFDSINTGAKVEGNLIWSTKSYIPRSAMFNLTLDLFGKSVNLMEFGGRAEGLEHMVQKYFGPGGVFSDNNINDVLRKRGKRSVSDDKMNLIDNQFTSETKEEPKGSLYFKIFGQEIRYFDFSQMTGSGSDFNVLEILIKLASNHDINFSKSIMFLDTTMTIPTILGLPLKLSINGTATLNMQIQGKMDVRRLHPSPRNMDISGSFKPSAAVEISSMMSVDANVARTGLKMVTTIHSSTAIEGKMQIDNSQEVKVKFEMPGDKVEIISAENKFFIVHQTQEIEQAMIDSNRVNSRKCTGDKMAKILGLELCGELSYPTTPQMSDVPGFPLTGPARMSVVLNKKDTHTSYDFEATLKTTKERKNDKTSFSHTARLAFNTPGSQVDREFLFDFRLNRGAQALNFELKTPWKKANLNGALVTQDDLKRATLRLMVDETKEYSVVTELQIDTGLEQGVEKKTYTPNIEIRIPERQPILISGSVSKAENTLLEYSLDVQQLFSTPVTMTGAIRRDARGSARNRYVTNFDLVSPILKTSLNGFLDSRYDNYKSRMSVTYQWQKRREETVNLNFKGRNTVTRSMRKMLFDTAISLSAYPRYNTHVKWEAETTDTHFETAVDVKYGPDPNDREKRLFASTILNYEKHGPKFNADARVKFSFPAKNVNLELSGKHHHDGRSMETKAELEYQPGKRINAQLNLMNHSGRLMKYSGSALLMYPGREMAISSKIEQTRKHEYHTSSKIQWQRSREIRETSMFKYDQGSYSFSSEITIPDQSPISLEGNLTPKKDDFKAKLKVDAMDQIYSGDVAYSYEKRGKELTGTASADFLYPGRHIVGSSDVKLFVNGEHSLKLDAKWDADNDQTKALTVDALYKQSKHDRFVRSLSYLTKHEATATVSLIGRHYLVQVTGEQAPGEYKAQALVDWQTDKMTLDVNFVNTKTATDRILSGNAKFTSPFTYVEYLSAGFNFNNNNDQSYTTGAEVNWARSKKITVDAKLVKASLKDMEGSIAIVTPFNGVTKMGLNGKFLVQNKELSLAIGGEAESRKIELEVTGKYKDTIEGALKVDLPFLSRKFGGSFSHKKNGNQYLTNAEVMWNRINKIIATLDLDITSAKKFSGNLQIDTPFSQAKSLGAILTHEIQNKEMNSKLSGNYNGQSMAIELKGKNNNGQSNRDMEGSIRITSPFENYDDMSISLKHNDDSRIFTSSMSAAWQRTKRVTASFYMKHQGQRWSLNNQGKIQITTPFRKFQRVGYEWKHSHTEDTLGSEHTVNINSAIWGINVGGNLRLINGVRVYGTVALKTPLAAIRNINSAAEFEINPRKVLAEFEVSSNGRRATAGFSLTGSSWADMEGTANLDVNAFLARPICPIAVEIKTEASSRPYTGHVKVTCDDVWRIDVNTDPQGWASTTLTATITTPMTGYESTVFELAHTGTSRSSESTATYDFNRKRIGVELKSNFEGTDKMKIDMKLVTPFNSFKNFKVSLDHDKDYRGFTDKFDFDYECSKGKTSFTSGFTYYGWKYMSGNLLFTSPYQRYEKFGMKFSHQDQNTKCLTTAEMEYRDMKGTVTTSTEYNPVKVTLSLSSPFNEISKATLTLQHEGQFPQTESSLTYEGTHFGSDAQLNGAVTINSLNDMSATLRLTHPRHAYNVALAHKVDQSEVQTSVAVDLDNSSDKKLTAILTCSVKADRANIRITTPYRGYEQINVGYTATKNSYSMGPVPGFDFNIDANIGSSYSSAIEIQFQGANKILAKFDLKTPIQGYERFLLNTEYQKKNQRKHEVSAILEYPQGKNEFTFTFQTCSNNQPLILQFMIKTPSYFLSSMSLDLEHSGTWSNFEHSMVFDYDAYISRVHIENKWLVEGLNHIVADARMTSPIKHFEYTGFSINHRLEEHEWTTSGSLEYSPGKRINLKNDIKFDRNFELDFEVTTPFRYGRIAAIKVEHEGGIDNPRKNEITLEFDSAKLTSEWEMRGMQSITGDMKFTSRIDGWERITLKASHNKEGTETVSDVEIKLPSSEEIKIDVVTKMQGGKRDIKIELHTPFDALNEAKLEYNDRFPTAQENNPLYKNTYFKFNFMMKNWQNPIHLNGAFTNVVFLTFNGNLEFSSTYQGYEALTLTFSNKVEEPLEVTTTAVLSLNRRQNININSFIDLVKWRAEFTLNTPFKPIQMLSIKFNHDILSSKPTVTNLVEIVHHCSRGQTKLESNWKLTPYQKYEGFIKLTSPYEKARLISFDYLETKERAMKKHAMTVGMAYNTMRIDYSGTVTRRDGKVMGSYTLQTPWERARDVQWNYEVTDLSYTEKPDYSNFLYKFDVTHNQLKKKMEHEIEWHVSDTAVDIQAKSSSQFYDDFTFSFVHSKKGIRNCETVMTTALGTKKVEWTSNYDIPSLEDMKLDIQLNFPVAGMYRRNKLDFTHSGDLQAFTSTVSLETNTFGKYAAELSWDMPSKVAVLKFDTPLTGWEKIILNFEHAMRSKTDFTTTVTATMPTKTFSFRTEFKMSPQLSLDVKVRTPFSVAKELSLLYTHTGDFNKFECNADAKYNTKMFTGKLQFQQKPTINFRIDLATPYYRYRTNHIHITHSGRLSRFTTTLDAKVNEPVTASLTFQMKPNIKVEAQMTTNLPQKYLKNPNLLLTINGGLKNFQATFNAAAGQPLIESSAKFQLSRNNLQFNGESTTTFLAGTESVKVDVVHRGPWTDFETDVQMSAKGRRGEKKITANVNFRYQGSISLKANLNTPFRNFEETSLEFAHMGEHHEYETTAKVKYSQRQTINAKVNLQTKPKVTFKAELETPFDHFEYNSVEAAFDGNSRRFTTSGKLTSYRRRSAGFSLSFMNFNLKRIQATLNVFTPMPSFESMTFKLSHSGHRQTFKTVLEYEDSRRRISEATLEYNGNPVTMTAKITSRYVILDLVHNGDLSNFQTTADLDVNDWSFKTKAMFNLRNVMGSLNIYTPWTDIDMSHSGDWSKFRSNVTVTYGEKKVDAIVSFDKAPMMLSVISSCPYSTIKIHHSGPLSSFRSAAEVLYGERAINALVTFSKSSRISGRATLTTPFKYAEDLSLSFDHFGNTRQFKSEGSVQWETGKTIKGEVEFRRNRRTLVTNVKVNTPWQKYENLALSLNHHGPKTQFRTTASVIYATGKRILAVVTYNHLSRGTFTFSSPIKYIKSLAATFNKAKVNNKDGYHAEFTWAPQKKITVDASGAFDGELTSASLNGYMKLQTPFDEVRDLIVDMDHSHSKVYAGNTLKVDYNSKRFIETIIEGKREDGKVTAEATMSDPWPLKAKVALNNGNNDKSANIDVNWDTTKYDKKVTLAVIYAKEGSYHTSETRHEIRLSVPRRVFALTSKIDKTRTQFAHTVSASMNGKEVTYTSRINNLSRPDKTDVNGIIMLATPLRTMKSAFVYKQTLRQINVEYDWFWNFVKTPNAKAGLRLKVDDYKQLYGANFEVTAILPKIRNMPETVTLRNTVVRRRGVVDTKTEFEYSKQSNDKITLNTRWAEITTGPHKNYTGMMQLTHPRTITDVKLDAHFGTSYSKGSVGLEMDYLSTRREIKNFRLLSEIDHVKETLTILIRSPLKTVFMLGKKVTTNEGWYLTHQSVHDGEDSVSSSLNIDLQQPAFNYKINYDPENSENVFKTYGKYFSNKEVVYETMRQHNGRHISEVYLSARLNSTRVLHSRIHWRPTLWSDIKKSALGLLEDEHPLMQTWQEVKRAVNEELTMKSELIASVYPDDRQARVYLAGEIRSFTEELVSVMDTLETMYENNEFYMQDINNAIQKAIKYIDEKTTILGYKIRQKYIDFQRVANQRLAYVRRTLTEVNGQIEKYVAAVVLKFRPAWQSYAYSVIKGYEDSTQKMKNGWEEMLESADEKWAAFVKTMDEKFDYISFKFEAYFDKIKAFQEELRTKLLSSKQVRWLDQIKTRLVNRFNQWKEQMDAKFQAWKTKVTTMYNKVATAVNAKMDQILGHKYSQIVINYFKAQQQKMLAKWQKWQVKIKLTKWLQSTYAKLKVYAKAQIKAILESYMRLENTGFTVFDPRNGEIQFELWLPLELNTLKEFPDISIETLKKEWSKLKEKYWPESDYSFWDTYYKFKPTKNYADWIPPFKAYATLTHGRHFTTFDGHHYDFAGTCSYLLTKDFTDGNFSVVVNYNNGKKTSFTVKSDNKEIEIFPDFKVSIDDLRTELPYQYKNTTVTRHGYSIKMTNANGFTMKCDMKNDICTFEITGWYFGRVAGLLGTYNNEQYDDKLTADRRIVDDIEQFARSWEVGRICHVSRNVARKATTAKGSETDKICRQYFENSDSVFRPCFKQVDPVPYLNNCISDIELDTSLKTVEEKGCGIFSSYVSSCQKRGVPIRVPPLCVTCKGPSGNTFKDGDEEKIDNVTPNVQSADVVFVVEEKGCHRNVANTLADMGVQIDNALKARGLQTNRFGVIGFGGALVHNDEQSHTSEGKLFNDARKLHLAINSLKFTPEGPNTDMLKAVKYATNYPFRTGVSKNVIILPCSECKVQAVAYAEMQQMLAEKDITLHVLLSHDFKLRTISPVKTSYIFGLDQRGVFTNKDVNARELRGDAVLKNQVIMPKDICTTLALETNGTVFNIQKLLGGRYTTQKAFMDVFARRVANSAHPTKCQVCECQPDKDGVGRSVCSKCGTPSFNYFFKFLPDQLKRKAVEYNYPEVEIPPLAQPPASGYEMGFEEYSPRSGSFQTIRRQ